MVTIDDIIIKLEKLNKLDQIRESIHNQSTIVNEIIVQQGILESRVNLLTVENKQLKSQVEKVNCELDRMKKHTLNSNIEIVGVPETVDENPEEISNKIFTHLGFTATNSKSAYRKKGYKNWAGLPQPIIVTIHDKGTRDQILKTKRNLQTTLDSHILSIPQETNNNHIKRIIYLNEHLTDHNKYLYKKTKIFSTWVH